MMIGMMLLFAVLGIIIVVGQKVQHYLEDRALERNINQERKILDSGIPIADVEKILQKHTVASNYDTVLGRRFHYEDN